MISPAAGQGLAQLAHVVIELVGHGRGQQRLLGRIQLEARGHGGEGRCVSLQGRAGAGDGGGELLGLDEVGVLGAQGVAAEALAGGLVAQVDLGRDARIREAVAGVEAPHQRGLGIQAHERDVRRQGGLVLAVAVVLVFVFGLGSWRGRAHRGSAWPRERRAGKARVLRRLAAAR